MAAHPPDPPRGALAQESATHLLSRLMSDASALLRNELALAKAEFRKTILAVTAGLEAIAIGAAVLLAGVLALIAAVILALAQVVEPWIAALSVGAGLALAGLLMLQTAKNKPASVNLTPRRTQTSLNTDAQAVARKT